MKTIAIKFAPRCGDRISTSITEALRLASRYNRPVTFRFNGTRFRVNKRLSAAHLLNQWDHSMAAASLRYRESKEGIAQARENRDSLAFAQETVTRLLAEFPSIVLLDDWMRWLIPFTEAADYMGVRLDRKELAATLERMGFKAGEHVGQPPEWFCSRVRIGYYIMGQVIDCLRMGMGPHPVTIHFVEKYFALPDCFIGSPA